jgi:hypothetical protein
MFGLFESIAIAIFGVGVFGIAVDDELYRLLNTVANLGTVALLVWHQRHVRRELEPKVDQAAALIRRKLGDRDPRTDGGPPHGVERRT